MCSFLFHYTGRKKRSEITRSLLKNLLNFEWKAIFDMKCNFLRFQPLPSFTFSISCTIYFLFCWKHMLNFKSAVKVRGTLTFASKSVETSKNLEHLKDKWLHCGINFHGLEPLPLWLLLAPSQCISVYPGILNCSDYLLCFYSYCCFTVLWLVTKCDVL